MHLFLDEIPLQIRQGIGAVVEKSAQQFRKELVRAVSDVIALPKDEIDRRVTVTKAGPVATRVKIDSASIPLIDFEYREVHRATNKRPNMIDLQVFMYRDREPRTYRAAFVGQSGLSQRGIYQRGITNARRAGRLPLHEKFAPSLADLVHGNPAMELRLRQRARTILAINLAAARDEWLDEALLIADRNASLIEDVKELTRDVIEKAVVYSLVTGVIGYAIYKRAAWKVDDPVYGLGAIAVIP